MKDPTLREAAQAAVDAMGEVLRGVPTWDYPPGFETWAKVANAHYTLHAAMERDRQAHDKEHNRG